ncbi:MAG TPA: HAD-IIIA family hydrolase, partial [Chitinophagaceae bacterium]|nr:HAD-IIIA family hydrolase [Chitinophagaceae bacterium]
VPEAVALLGRIFGRIIVVSNQKCVGKGLITTQQMEEIHSRMVREITAAGGRIDRVYYCPDLEQDSDCRKPNTGMGIQASRDYPEIDFFRSLLIGNKLSDMDFGRRLGMTNIFVRTTDPSFSLPHPWVDQVFEDLPAASQSLGLQV